MLLCWLASYSTCDYILRPHYAVLQRLVLPIHYKIAAVPRYFGQEHSTLYIQLSY